MEERSLAREEILHNKLDAILNILIALESNTSGIMRGSKTPEHFSSCLKEPTKQSGTYLIELGQNKQPVKVNCEQNVEGGGWIVFQYRYNGKENFFRNWSDYRDGFGDLNGEYWLGLENIHQITAARPHELMVEIKDFHGNYGYAHYDEFEIGNESEGYNLKKLGEFQGSAGDAMDSNRGEKFSTADRPNDAGTCAVIKKGGWWYDDCSYANINGPYMNVKNAWGAMSWYNFHNDYRGLSYSRMMMRELNGDE
ncbi:microfibril-associated glycoprotein 4-like [Anopheles ziemanni]|uniref:microfibril-associated glycoprotein 4-like n=1 Tax=Anopheles coustani TaxID=139045 RepID=UPI002658D7AF|nr:microfibril-associated glycoprotein 4-like [Anopheles coustani]XP_058177338.1 microfibril-associated glycoprotein 4-like [Anopheles ziemanni]